MMEIVCALAGEQPVTESGLRGDGRCSRSPFLVTGGPVFLLS